MLWVRYVQIHCYFFFIAQFIWRPDWKEPYKMLSSLQFGLQSNFIIDYFLKPSRNLASYPIPVNPPPFHGSLPRKSLISRMDGVSCAGDINLPHDLPPTKKSSTIKSWPTFCDQYFWKFPIWNSCADEKCREIRMVKVFKWYLVIDLFDTFTGKLSHGD